MTSVRVCGKCGDGGGGGGRGSLAELPRKWMNVTYM